MAIVLRRRRNTCVLISCTGDIQFGTMRLPTGTAIRGEEPLMPKTNRMIRFGVSMEQELLGEFDSLCTGKGYENRSEAIRDMVRNLIMENALQEENTESVGTLTLVYNHHQRELGEKLTEYQHHNLRMIVSTLHIHLSHHLCLEVLLLRGKAKEIRKIADGLIATRGVRNGKLVLTAAGRGAR
jgi:CopG family transcriptional regulator, nickel-responsive regulator